MSMPKVTRTIKEMSFEENMQKAVQNDWIMVPVIILLTILAVSALSIMFYGADRFIEEAAQMIYEVRN